MGMLMEALGRGPGSRARARPALGASPTNPGKQAERESLKLFLFLSPSLSSPLAAKDTFFPHTPRQTVIAAAWPGCSASPLPHARFPRDTLASLPVLCAGLSHTRAAGSIGIAPSLLAFN